MISDTLLNAAEAIREFLRNEAELYSDDIEGINHVLVAMDELRLKLNPPTQDDIVTASFPLIGTELKLHRDEAEYLLKHGMPMFPYQD